MTELNLHTFLFSKLQSPLGDKSALRKTLPILFYLQNCALTFITIFLALIFITIFLALIFISMFLALIFITIFFGANF